MVFPPCGPWHVGGACPSDWRFCYSIHNCTAFLQCELACVSQDPSCRQTQSYSLGLYTGTSSLNVENTCKVKFIYSTNPLSNNVNSFTFFTSCGTGFFNRYKVQISYRYIYICMWCWVAFVLVRKVHVYVSVVVCLLISYQHLSFDHCINMYCGFIYIYLVTTEVDFWCWADPQNQMLIKVRKKPNNLCWLKHNPLYISLHFVVRKSMKIDVYEYWWILSKQSAWVYQF